MTWFQDHLVPQMEVEGVKLCLHTRDFQVKSLKWFFVQKSPSSQLILIAGWKVNHWKHCRLYRCFTKGNQFIFWGHFILTNPRFLLTWNFSWIFWRWFSSCPNSTRPATGACLKLTCLSTDWSRYEKDCLGNDIRLLLSGQQAELGAGEVGGVGGEEADQGDEVPRLLLDLSGLASNW